MVPTQYLIPDLMVADLDEDEDNSLLMNNADTKREEKSRPSTLITDFKPHQLDLSAHIVNDEARSFPSF
jgi:hypothetical protein